MSKVLLDTQNRTANQGNLGSAMESLQSSRLKHRESNGNPLQYSCLENPTDGGAWQAAVHGVAKSRTQLGDFTFTFHFHALEKEMATHSSVLAWRIPGTTEPDGLPSMGLHRVGQDRSDLAAAADLSTQINLLKCKTYSERIVLYWNITRGL